MNESQKFLEWQDKRNGAYRTTKDKDHHAPGKVKHKHLKRKKKNG